MSDEQWFGLDGFECPDRTVHTTGHDFLSSRKKFFGLADLHFDWYMELLPEETEGLNPYGVNLMRCFDRLLANI